MCAITKSEPKDQLHDKCIHVFERVLKGLNSLISNKQDYRKNCFMVFFLFFYDITKVSFSLTYFVELFKHLVSITQVRQNILMYYYISKLYRSNSLFYGQKE